MKKIFFIAIAFFIFSLAPIAQAADPIVTFYVDQDYELNEKESLQATLVKTTSNLYFYIERNWWESQSDLTKNGILARLDALSAEFGNTIYPRLTAVLGSEWRPGIDNDNKITILFHEIEGNVTGYFRTTDEYSKLQVPSSNEREMVYLSTAYIASSHLKEFLAHEFTHLIIFNQKERVLGTLEEVWLNEAIADYALTIVGYNDVYQGSNLQRRVEDFLQKPDDSLTEWQNTKYDYAVANVFTHYLVDHYGLNVLSNSLKSNAKGIVGLNQALMQSGAKEDFAQIFTNWTVAVVANNCALGPKYCYLRNSLAHLKINPTLIFLPTTGNSSLSLTNFTKNWAGNWEKIVGGNEGLKLQFSSRETVDFKIPYILIDKGNNYSVNFLSLDLKNIRQLTIEDFSNTYSGLIIIPSLQGKISGFNGAEASYQFDIAISTTTQSQQDYASLVQELLVKIEALKKQIANLQAGLPTQGGECTLFVNLYYGVRNASHVRCLQQFLKDQGPMIYPEGLVTGTFGNLTKTAVVRFQQAYGIPATGFVGILTRTKINELLNVR